MILHSIHTLRIESKSIDHTSILQQSKASWPGIPRLRPRRNATYFDIRESHIEQSWYGGTIFVKARCQSNRTRKLQSSLIAISNVNPSIESNFVGCTLTAKPWCQPISNDIERQMMRTFGVEQSSAEGGDDVVEEVVIGER